MAEIAVYAFLLIFWLVFIAAAAMCCWDLAKLTWAHMCREFDVEKYFVYAFLLAFLAICFFLDTVSVIWSQIALLFNEDLSDEEKGYEQGVGF